jgi:hypothetical protein
MSTYDHDLLKARFAALAPRPVPGDWDDVLGRAGSVGPHRRRLAQPRWRGGRRRKLVVVLAVAALVAAVAAAAYGTVRVIFLDRGFTGLPPVGATPSAPESGELVLHWDGRSATHAKRDRRGGYLAPYVGARVYADGRVIWWRDAQVPEGANEFISGWLEQRLTPEGVELMRSQVVALMDSSRALLETVPGAANDPLPGPFGGLALFVPRDYASSFGSVEVGDDDRFVRLQWREVGALGDPRRRFEGTIATPEQLAALRRIDALFTDSASVLPSSAWAVREVRAYVPSHYAVCIAGSPSKDASQLLSQLPGQAADVLRDKSWTRVADAYCTKLATDEARGVANAVSGFPRHPWPLTLSYEVAEGVNKGEPTSIEFNPYFPHGGFVLHGGGR